MSEQIHSCFISYRHPASAGGREDKLIRHVVQAIMDHFALYTHNHEVYYDKNRLVPGYQYDERLSSAICRSACMIVIYWPSYLESDYCRKEMTAMLDIEKRRKKKLKGLLDGCRLFVPIILRGKFDDLPSEVRNGCHYLDYAQQALRPDVNLGDDPETSEKLYKIADYVKTLCDKMKGAEKELFEGCGKFRFAPEIVGTRAKLALIDPQQPFPGR